MTELSLQGVEKAYGDINVLHDIHLSIASREFVVFVGPSGCGKSTLLRCIAGLETITGGSIHIGARDVTVLEPADRGVAMVFQSYALYPHMTVYDNIAFGLKMQKVATPRIDEKVREAARILQLEPLLQRKPKALSGGQRQRVAIGRAIVHEPQVFLLDEPLSNLDASLRVQMRIEIAKLHAQLQATMIYVTHDQVEAMTLADRVVVMNGGIIEQVGPPQELYHNPKTRFVAGFIGSPAMNFIPGRLENGSGALRVHLPGDIVLPVPESRTARYAALAGREVVFGIRPEHLTEEKNLDRPNFVRFPATPEVTEPMGMETLVHFKIQGAEICGRVDPNAPAHPGQPLAMAADLNNMHILDPQSGRVL